MGCDIHLVLQRLDEGKWVDVTTNEWTTLDGKKLDYVDFWEPRSYGTFGAIAGVRGGGWPPIQQGRGLPTDFDVVEGEYHRGGRQDYDDDPGLWMGDHSYGWCTLAELISFSEEWADDDGEMTTWTMIPHWIAAMKELGEPEDVRIVFGFDS